jgi:hypothetical protein
MTVFNIDNAPITGCPDCATTAGRAGCTLHSRPVPTTAGPGVSIVQEVMHRHRWVYDGLTPYDQQAVYHCDDHDPPVVRIVGLRP